MCGVFVTIDVSFVNDPTIVDSSFIDRHSTVPCFSMVIGIQRTARDKDMCIICVVGDLEWENVGFEAKALDAMRDIPVRMISFGGSNYNISFLIRECDKKQALQSLSDALFNE